VLGLLGRPHAVPVSHIILPIGISFYTFNSMSYTIDIYRGKVEPARSAIDYAAFVALFPHLIAGPIVRYSDIDVQLRSLARRLTSGMAVRGVSFFAVGLFKKVVIADSLAPTVNALYAHPGHLGLVASWSAALGYALQLYFDFSGYSDMAVGLAMLLGFRFPQNFDSPYKALNISDFWRRWHISLSSWLRDYLFISMGGSRAGKLRTLRNLALTMFLGGLWHGAGWTFVVWGLGHGALLVGHTLLRDRGWTPRWEWASRAMTFVCVVVLWVPFRAPTLRVAGSMLASMVGLHGVRIGALTSTASVNYVPTMFLVALGVLLVFVNVVPNTWQIKFSPTRRNAVMLGFAGACGFLLLAAPSPFLYFQF
jgi:alginate O-acetyltransferase complex protein AlgI